MDLLIAFFVMIGLIIGLSVLFAWLHGGTGADLLDADPRKRMEQRYAAEYEDMDNLLEAHNHRRAARGLPPQTEEEFDEERRRQERRWRQNN